MTHPADRRAVAPALAAEIFLLFVVAFMGGFIIGAAVFF